MTTREAVGTGTPMPVVLLGSQLVFNVGFYAVVPFLAVVMREDFLLGGAAIGLVLGLRTFAQQGMFVVGGALCDRYGPRATIVAGCAVRTGGYLTLAAAMTPPSPALLLTGTVLTGLGGALFSPALESSLGRVEADRRAAGDRRTSLFALLTVVGETGAALGPVLGVLLLGWGFAAAATAGAALFAVVGVALAVVLPRTGAALGDRASLRPSTWPSLRNRPFLAFAALGAVNGFAYNQLYLGLPVEVERVGVGPGGLATVFLLVSVLTIALQVPVARVVGRRGAPGGLTTGYLLVGAGFAVLAVAATLGPPDGWELAPALGGVAVLTLGHLVVTPTALGLVPTFAGGAPLGSYYGLLATAGGTAVLVGNVAIGPLYALADVPGPAAAVPWAVLALLTLVPATLLPRVLDRPLRHTTTNRTP